MTRVSIHFSETAPGRMRIDLEGTGVPSDAPIRLGGPEFMALPVPARFAMVLTEAIQQTDLGNLILSRCFVAEKPDAGPKYPCRCRIIDAEGQQIDTPEGTFACKTPDVSRPKIDKTGTAYLEPDGINVRIKLDDGSELMGYECWWEPISA